MILSSKSGERKKDKSGGDSTLTSLDIDRVHVRSRMIDIYRLRRANFSIAADRSRNVNKTMRDDAMLMRGAYDAPRASMSPSAEGDHRRWGRVERQTADALQYS